MTTESTDCHPLSGVCLMLKLIGLHLENHDWVNPAISKEMLPLGVRVVYKSAVEPDEREDALPIVAYAITGITMRPFMPRSVVGGSAGNTASEVAVAAKFTVSTTSEALTAELALDIGGFLIANYDSLRKNKLHLGNIEISGVQRDQTGYYMATISVSAQPEYPVWKKSNSQDILREVSIQVSDSE